MNRQHLNEVAAFIREHRGQEGNFDALRNKLNEEATGAEANETYKNALHEIEEKWAEEYRARKEAAGTAWPEFETFVTAFEKAVIGAAKESGNQ